jgi:hypothetical protein
MSNKEYHARETFNPNADIDRPKTHTEGCSKFDSITYPEILDFIDQ